MKFTNLEGTFSSRPEEFILSVNAEDELTPSNPAENAPVESREEVKATPPEVKGVLEVVDDGATGFLREVSNVSGRFSSDFEAYPLSNSFTPLSEDFWRQFYADYDTLYNDSFGLCEAVKREGRRSYVDKCFFLVDGYTTIPIFFGQRINNVTIFGGKYVVFPSREIELFRGRVLRIGGEEDGSRPWKFEDAFIVFKYHTDVYLSTSGNEVTLF